MDYPVAVLIVLILMFWFTCKCIGSESCDRKHVSEGFSEGHLLGRMKERMDEPNELLWAGDPVVWSHRRILDKVSVPNSKTAYRDLIDEDIIPCGIDTFNDKEPSSMFLQKNRLNRMKHIPVGLTEQRRLNNIDENDRKPMPSY